MRLWHLLFGHSPIEDMECCDLRWCNGCMKVLPASA